MRFFGPFFQFLVHLGYFGPLLMGVLDSSFLVLPFGNDLVVVGMVAQHPKGVVLFVLAAAVGSTIGALLLALVSHKLGEEGLSKLAGERRYKRLKDHLGRHAGVAVAFGGLAPPPFPFTTVIAGAALNYPIWRLLLINFFSRAVRFTLLSLLALKFGREVIRAAESAPFKWAMIIFIAGCVVASGFSIVRLLKKPR